MSMTEPMRPKAPKPQETPRAEAGETTPWLSRPGTARLLWIAGAVVLVLLIAADFAVSHKSYFPIAKDYAFGAWYGFAATLVLVVLARVLAALLRRSETDDDR